MKKITLAILFLLFHFAPASAQDYLQRFEYMESNKIKDKWGAATFSASQFAKGNELNRAKLAFSLIESKFYINKTIQHVFSDLGPSTGYFFSESVPAYIIGDINEKPDEVWQIVFLLSKDSKTIAAVRVQKKCCYK